MFIDLLSEACEEGEEFLYWVTKISQYFEDKFVQISLNFGYLLQAISVETLIGLGMPLFYWPYLGSVRRKIIVTIIKHHTYHTLYIQAIYKHT